MLTTIIDHRDDLRIVGARVYSDSKAGQDVGILAGRAPIGVAATTDVNAVLELEADCVLYTPRSQSIDDVCSLLSSGKNVATTAFQFHPARINTADRARVLNACRTGGTTVHGGGLNPGNLSSALPLALSGMSPTIDKITLQERADWSAYESTPITFDNMAFRATRRRHQPAHQPVPGIQQRHLHRTSVVDRRLTQRGYRRGHRIGRGRSRRSRPSDLRPPAQGGNHCGTTLELVRRTRRRGARRNRDAMDGGR